MSYSFTTRKDDELISHDDWVAALNAVDGVRPFDPQQDAEAQKDWAWIFVNDEWQPGFFWSGGRATFEMWSDEVYQAGLKLAKILGAKVVGEEGEEYDGEQETERLKKSFNPFRSE